MYARMYDPAESHEAGAWVDAARSVQATLDIMYEFVEPVTHKQVEERAYDLALPWSPERMRTAVRELERKGLVVKVGSVKPARGRRRGLYELAAFHYGPCACSAPEVVPGRLFNGNHMCAVCWRDQDWEDTHRD